MEARAGPAASAERCDKLFAAGNYKEAYEGYRRLALDPNTEPDRVGGDLTRAIECLGQLGREAEVDAFRDAVIAVHKDNWRLLQAAAESLFNDQHYGFIVAGAFQRGQHRGGGRHVGSYERDRARALQLLVRGLDRARTDPDRAAAGRYLLAFRADADGRPRPERFLAAPGPHAARRPARLRRQPVPALEAAAAGAPVEPDGTPVYYRVPEGLAKAKNDGERWRWALAQAAEADAGLLNTTRSTLATFLVGQFGTQTIRGEGVGEGPTDGPPGANGPYALDTLSDDETIARLATGIRRFKLPDEFSFIKIFQAIADEPKTGQGEESLRFPGVDLREPPAVRSVRRIPEAEHRGLRRQGQGQVPADRPDPRRLGRVRGHADPARRPGRRGRLPLPQRPPRPLRGTRDPL